MNSLRYAFAVAFISAPLLLVACGDDGAPSDGGVGDSAVGLDGAVPPSDSAVPPGDSSVPPTDGSVSGRCGTDVTELADHSAFKGRPWDMVERGDYLYVADRNDGRSSGVADDGNLLRVPKTGGPHMVIDSEGDSTEQVTIFGDDLYWINRGAPVETPYMVRTSPIESLAPRTLITLDAPAFGLETFYGNPADLLEINNDGIFMSVFGRFPDGSPEVRERFLLRVALAGDTYDVFGHGGPVDDTHLYAFEDGTLVRTSTAGGDTTTLCECDGRLLQVGDSHVYFVLDAAMWRVAKDGGAPEELGVTPSDVMDLTLTESHVYYITNTVIGRIPLEGGLSSLIKGVVSTLATGLISDDECLYWLDGTMGGGVYSLGIPPG